MDSRRSMLAGIVGRVGTAGAGLLLVVGVLASAGGCATASPERRLAPRPAPVVMSSARGVAWLRAGLRGGVIASSSTCTAMVPTKLGVIAYDRWIGIATQVVVAPRTDDPTCPAPRPRTALIW